MRLVLIHGMRQEGRVAGDLRDLWVDALEGAWRKAGIEKPKYDVEMPFYGDLLHRLTEEVRGRSSPVVAKGFGGAGEFSPLETALLREIGTREGVTDADVRRELEAEVVAKGPANWEWVQAIGRILERRIPPFRSTGLSFVRQVDAYLTRPHITQAVDNVVRPALQAKRCIVVAHSLGSIVAYRLLRELGSRADVPLFVTLGSPLGINAVKDRIRPPKLLVPEGVSHWLNGADERDYVALYSKLCGEGFADGIEDIAEIHNRHDDAHHIGDYLTHPAIALRIAIALAE